VEAGALVRDKALALGFDAVGIARADVPLDADVERYRAFLADGLHGEMSWLADHADVRSSLDGDGILRGAASVVCLARRYSRAAEDEAADPPLARTIARYARGRDYHNGLRKKLRQLAAFVRTLGTVEAPVHARPLCDDAPVLERAWAARAGLGFVGKNGLLIVPGQGSMVLLGEVVTSLRLDPDEPLAGRCGSCVRCLEACPTDAFVRPFVLDARRCIAYLTIEHRGSAPDELRERIGEHAFGCDDCQTVCPFNASSRARDPGTTRTFAPHERWRQMNLVDFLGVGDAQWSTFAEGTPLHRATRAGMARNAAIVLGNRRDREARPALETAARDDASQEVRDAACWALARLDAND
jgi:epoxyqueuosine reductase